METRVDIRDVFLSGENPNRLTEPDRLRRLINRLKPISVGRDLIRIGGEGDGGYLVPDDLKGVVACFSPGVGAKIDFERTLADQYGIRSYLADYSVDGPPQKHSLIDFEKKFIGIFESEKEMRLQRWMEDKKAELETGDLILQMDIEGGEFAILVDADYALLLNFRIMVIEFHWSEMFFNRICFIFILSLFEKILREFYVVHIHPNNCCPLLTYNDIAIPRVFEVTFYRRDRARPDGRKLIFPHPLDRKNAPHHPDIVLPKCWW